MNLIKQILNIDSIPKENLERAIEDIRRMQSEPEYAKKTHFDPNAEQLNYCFDWNSSKLGYLFWENIYNEWIKMI